MQRRSIPNNAAWLLSGRIGTAAVAVLVAIVAARHLGAAMFGTYAAILAAGLLANTLITFGTDTLVVRSVASGCGTADARASLGLQLCLLVPMLVLGVAVALVTGVEAAVGLQTVGLLPGVWGTTATAVLRGRERMDLVAGSMLLGGFALLVGSGAARLAEARVWTYVLAAVVAQAVTATSAVFWARGPVRPAFVGSMVRRSAPFAVMVISSSLVAASGVVALRVLSSDGDAGGLRRRQSDRRRAAVRAGGRLRRGVPCNGGGRTPRTRLCARVQALVAATGWPHSRSRSSRTNWSKRCSVATRARPTCSSCSSWAWCRWCCAFAGRSNSSLRARSGPSPVSQCWCRPSLSLVWCSPRRRASQSGAAVLVVGLCLHAAWLGARAEKAD